jgi:putative hydrolase of the HAD superfamily
VSRRTLRAVLFDLDDTLYATTEFSREARAAAVHAMIAAGLRVPFERVLAELEAVIAKFSSNYDRHLDTLLLRLPAESYAPVNPAVIVAAGVVAYHETKRRSLAAYPDALEALARLSSCEGLTLGVVTAGLPTKQAEKLVRLGVLPHFDPRAVFIADQLGFEKTNPQLYATVCAALSLEPGQCMYVGDHPVRDVDSSRAAGMIAVLLRYGGKYSGLVGQTAPDYTIGGFRELIEIIERDFEVPQNRS